jgi:hypothetical protein
MMTILKIFRNNTIQMAAKVVIFSPRPSRGNPRQVHRILVTALRLAADKKLNHLPDDIIKEAIGILKQD